MESRFGTGDWKKILDSIQDVVMILDARQRIIWGNRSLTEFLSLPEEDIVDRPCHQMIHGVDSPGANCHFHRMMKSGMRETFEMGLGGPANFEVEWGTIAMAHKSDGVERPAGETKPGSLAKTWLEVNEKGLAEVQGPTAAWSACGASRTSSHSPAER